MKHVFVETNFLVELLRPFPDRAAVALGARHGTDVTLHIPWCAFAEARRTLERIIREDLGFIEGTSRFLGAVMSGTPRPDAALHANVRDLVERARVVRRESLFDYLDRLEEQQRRVVVIPPSATGAGRTLQLFRVKVLTPFDEMILGAVLDAAERLRASGETDLWFCNLNKNDFAPTTGNDLQAAYAHAGLTYSASFAVP